MNCNLVLSGGGARGYAHIGAVQALQEKGLKFDAISGTSSGAIVGAFLCDGFTPGEITEILRLQKPKLKVNLLHIRESILSFSAFSTLLKKNLRSKRVEDLRIPLYIALTDLHNGRQKIMSSGNLVEILTAASALPVFFPPVKIDDVPYADGGMSNNLPVEAFSGSDKILVGIHVNPVQDFSDAARLRLTLDRAMHIIVRNNILPAIEKCDLFIEPRDLVKYHVFEADKSEEIIRCGYNYVKSEISLSGLQQAQRDQSLRK